jgi:hypothetical protein
MSEQSLRQEIAELRARVEAVDDWANSVHAALGHVALQLAYSSPQAAAGLLAVLEHDAMQCDQLVAGAVEPTDSADSPALLESARQLYRELGSSLRHIASEQSARPGCGS